jgi:hypothetical protein
MSEGYTLTVAVFDRSGKLNEQAYRGRRPLAAEAIPPNLGRLFPSEHQA